MIEIDSSLQVGEELPAFDELKLKNEPMLFNCTWSAAYVQGGPATREFIKKLPRELWNDRTIIDSRVHMLMPGWYPCIPGYHHDDVPRSGQDGQPNYFTPEYRSKHAMVLYNGDICPTEFALGKAEFSNPLDHKIVYKEWHKEVVEMIDIGLLRKFQAPPNRIIYFDDRTWHQGTKAVKNGWRLFVRASWDTNRKPTNEIRRQVQVYLENPMEGW